MITVSPEPGKYDSVKVLQSGRQIMTTQITVYKHLERDYVQIRLLSHVHSATVNTMRPPPVNYRLLLMQSYFVWNLQCHL